MRHGQTEWNLAGRRQGRLDSALTQTGRENAVRLATMLETAGIDRIFSSPLARARRTAEIVAERLRIDVQLVPDLAEVHHGVMAGLTDPEIAARFPDEWRSRANRPSCTMTMIVITARWATGRLERPTP